MLIGIPAETLHEERRVAATPETVKKFVARGHTVRVQRGAGMHAGLSDEQYSTAGAELSDDTDALAAQLVLKVRAPTRTELTKLRSGTALVGMLDPFDADGIAGFARAGLSAFALEAAPRTSRAQSIDVLSSQANIAGYKAVVIAAERFQRIFPMLMTAAGTVKAARVFVLGVGVAGLQAIATARRLGAVVEASDVRPAVKEQVESLGAKFVDVPCETQEEQDAAQGQGGYARMMPESWLQRQKVEVANRVAAADIVITTALVPGRRAPVLVTEEMVKTMKPGSVVVDLAAAAGGNCPLTTPGQTISVHGVTIVGETNLPGLVATDASTLYSRNVLEFVRLLTGDDGNLRIDLEDDIIAACLIAHNGQEKRSDAKWK
ncbi:Re/Si-specific NAD(P)(+) transhydrogenase subunit alpha [Paraburkholderia dipogonis]|uniref:NAD(P) transhydrogenase subunit alpha part 1 n=1 Tax=Paraburkholderia dipogonis TaxID=1211383 RepID=A0A4Y8MVG5_9BURK|nr:Re/Si-specific NAD(P)(+) transhydrogenase subunit alpha [Paraburkholderia dipogonis]TFE41540.1 Re/Si-specific NAD(P)(+) transhydrogenase subunit alpha [Paraburkholderia dipogonis]